MPDNKSHHFVPRFILKNFSFDGARLGLYLFDSARRVDVAPLKHQCCRDYLYGEDGKLESALAAAESDVGALFARVLRGSYELTERDLFNIRFFVLYQLQRTLVAASDVEELVNLFTKGAMRPWAERRGIDVSQVAIKAINPMMEAMVVATKAIPAVMDLEVKFLVSNGRSLFITSDNPVAVYNQWAEHHPAFTPNPEVSGLIQGVTGLALKGVQLFMPIAPRVCVMLYDPSTYDVGHPQRHHVTVGKKDVETLNRMQAVVADKCIYFRPQDVDDAILVKLRNERTKYESCRKLSIRESVMILDGERGRVVAWTPPDLRIGAKLAVAVVNDHRSYRKYVSVPHRSPELDLALEQFGRRFKDQGHHGISVPSRAAVK